VSAVCGKRRLENKKENSKSRSNLGNRGRKGSYKLIGGARGKGTNGGRKGKERRKGLRKLAADAKEKVSCLMDQDQRKSSRKVGKRRGRGNTPETKRHQNY